MNMLNKIYSTKFVDMEVDGIDTDDYPDFCDAYIAYANVEHYIFGLLVRTTEATERQLEALNEDQGLVYELAVDRMF